MRYKQHYFFAAKLPSTAKTYLFEWIEEHKDQYPFKKWVHLEDYHITLAFLGFIEPQLLQLIIRKVGFILKDESSFNLTFNKLGIFGKETSPRIFWAGIHDSDSLLTIQKKVYNQCIETGISLDKKPFRPHITLARKWDSEQMFQSDCLKELKQNHKESFMFHVNEIVLYQTVIDKVPKYKVVHSFKLR